jgi:DNA-directed RNA polymerase specialized sigma24 family protein
VSGIDLRSISVSLTSEGFERFLALLAAEREAAGEQYELVRLKLVKYFELRMSAHPDDLADETIDRVARRLAGGERIESPEVMRYVYGVARNVLLESWKNEQRQKKIGYPPAANDDSHQEDADLQLDCFQECLGQIPQDSHGLLLRYYQHTGRTKINDRLAMAQEHTIPANALRIRIHRIKAELQRCIETCMKRVRNFATVSRR